MPTAARRLFGSRTLLLVGHSPLRGCFLLTPRRRPKSLAAPLVPIYEMASRLERSELKGLFETANGLPEPAFRWLAPVVRPLALNEMTLKGANSGNLFSTEAERDWPYRMVRG
jgi:hypothetical protein